MCGLCSPRRGSRWEIAELHKGPRDILERAGLLDHIGETMIFEDLEEAAAAFAGLSHAPR